MVWFPALIFWNRNWNRKSSSVLGYLYFHGGILNDTTASVSWHFLRIFFIIAISRLFAKYCVVYQSFANILFHGKERVFNNQNETRQAGIIFWVFRISSSIINSIVSNSGLYKIKPICPMLISPVTKFQCFYLILLLTSLSSQVLDCSNYLSFQNHFSHFFLSIDDFLSDEKLYMHYLWCLG